jgi:hypothetical protein
VPIDFRGLPRALLGVSTESRTTSSSLSESPFKGTVVVVVFSFRRIVGARYGVGDTEFRLICDLGPFSLSELSASTVTLIFCGDSSFPTSSSNVCFLGELPCRGREVRNRVGLHVFAGEE